MDICVCGGQVPFVRGGAEMLMDNLVDALGAAGHRAELVRLPTAWDRVRIFDAALAWRMIPLDVDLVIATNFPSYFVRHPNKIVWLLHQHRIAYDGVDQPWSDFGTDDDSLEAQRLLAEWDSHALAEARARFTISEVVVDRLARYNGLSSTALYHPPPLHDRLHEGPMGDYVLTATRLEANKRPRPLVEAAALVQAPITIKVAGSGSQHDALAATAARQGGLGTVELLGFVDDDELISLFAGALAVVYAPIDEDYGYVTLQAFLAGKPVITASDSGGVLEWVEDGVNGFVTDGSPAGIARAIDTLRADPDLAVRMGRAGREKAASVSWSTVVDTLLAP